MTRRSTVRWILATLGVMAIAPFWAPLVGLAPRPLPPPGRLIRVGGHFPDFVEWPRRWAVSAGFPARAVATIFGRTVFNGAPPAGWTDHALSVVAAPGVIHSWMMEAKHMDVTSLHPDDVDVLTTIVQGDADVLSPMDVATMLHRAIPSSSLVAVPGGTHMLPNTHADLLVSQVRMLASRMRAADSHAAAPEAVRQ